MSAYSPSPFRLRTVLALVVFGFIAFIAMLYFIGAGDTGNRGNDGRAHAASTGLNGFAGLVKLLELEGIDASTSRSPVGLETYGLLVLTPPPYTDADELGELLESRMDRGPTIVILPKWYAVKFPDELPSQIEEQLDQEIRDGWVRLSGAGDPEWTADLPEPYGFETSLHEEKRAALRWAGMGLAGPLPEARSLAALPTAEQDALVEDSGGGALVIDVMGEQGSDFSDSHTVLFVVEPDLMNNFGLAERSRAALALELVRYASYDDAMPVVFDLTLNGFGGTTNLLTLAFRPPFLAATLCLILALLVIGWRAFRRFGPAVAEGPAIAFGKRRLIGNGAGLILRAKRFRLLGEPYAALVARRLQARLGLVRPDEQAIDEALARRLPDEAPFSQRADRLRAASRPAELLSAAAALKELEGKLDK